MSRQQVAPGIRASAVETGAEYTSCCALPAAAAAQALGGLGRFTGRANVQVLRLPLQLKDVLLLLLTLALLLLIGICKSCNQPV